MKDHLIAQMVNELTATCKTHGHAQCLRGELLRIVNSYLKPPVPCVHYLKHGFLACGSLIATLPTGDKLSDNIMDVNCRECYKACSKFGDR